MLYVAPSIKSVVPKPTEGMIDSIALICVAVSKPSPPITTTCAPHCSTSEENITTLSPTGSSNPDTRLNRILTDPLSALSGSVKFTVNAWPIALPEAGSVKLGTCVSVPENATPVDVVVVAGLLAAS